jgi:hypothetical protein
MHFPTVCGEDHARKEGVADGYHVYVVAGWCVIHRTVFMILVTRTVVDLGPVGERQNKQNG